MTRAALTIGLLLTFHFASAQLACKRQGSAKPNLNVKAGIIGGTTAVQNSWPWLAFLSVDNSDDTENMCGCNLIQVGDNTQQTDVVVTAAHCITEEKSQKTKPVIYSPVSRVKVLAGAHRRREEEPNTVTRTAQIIEYRPGYIASKDQHHDIAIVKLDKPIAFTETIRPICMPTQGEAIPAGQTCAIAGWGRNSSTNKDSTADVLQQLVLPVHSAETCTETWADQYKEDMMICAGTMTGASSMCEGDSGGSLACLQPDGSWTLYGLSSFVAGDCNEKNSPAIFTRVSSYVNWINERALSSLPKRRG